MTLEMPVSGSVMTRLIQSSDGPEIEPLALSVSPDARLIGNSRAHLDCQRLEFTGTYFRLREGRGP